MKQHPIYCIACHHICWCQNIIANAVCYFEQGWSSVRTSCPYPVTISLAELLFTTTPSAEMVTAERIAALTASADGIDGNRTSATDVFDRAQMLSQRVEELSALTCLHTPGVQMRLTQVLQALSVPCRVKRPASEISSKAILSPAFRIRHIMLFFYKL